jgi:hypothetical protein
MRAFDNLIIEQVPPDRPKTENLLLHVGSFGTKLRRSDMFILGLDYDYLISGFQDD